MSGQRKAPAGNGGPSKMFANTQSHSLTDVRQNEADALFGADVGAYGTATYTLPDDPPATAPQRKQTGMVTAWRNAGTAWKKKALVAVLELASTGQPFTADDIRAKIGDDGISPQAWGSLFNGAARKGLIKKVSYVTSDRAERHGSVIAQWVGVL